MQCGRRRRRVIARHLSPHRAAGRILDQNSLRQDGWGYADTAFEVQGDVVRVTGNRYDIAGTPLPSLVPFIREFVPHFAKLPPTVSQYSPDPLPARRNSGFEAAVEGHYGRIAWDAASRCFHSHGHTCEELLRLRVGDSAGPRSPDAVMWPRNHSDVLAIVRAAVEHGVGIVPFGGGTSVTNALQLPRGEDRMTISLDMHLMHRILWIDEEAQLACVEAGATGTQLEAELASRGFMLGHEPDSLEFSTLGGWVATRSSGMKKNRYGNIEDIVVALRVVTPRGELTTNAAVPRASTGPDMKSLFIGSEGIFGVVTQVTLQLDRPPSAQRFGSLVFPGYGAGCRFMRAVAANGCWPASIRLVDNTQFRFGQALKPALLMDAAKKKYVTGFKGFDPTQLCAATFCVEVFVERERLDRLFGVGFTVHTGDPHTVKSQEATLIRLAKAHGGFSGGADAGKKGYELTFNIAYLRDMCFNYGVISESFEASIRWSQVLRLCLHVKQTLHDSCDRFGVSQRFVSCRVTQNYKTGACVYFYFGFDYSQSVGLERAAEVYEHIESEARDAIIELGGSLSHHHGVGKIRAKWMTEAVSELGVQLMQQFKGCIDPTNVMCAGNLYWNDTVIKEEYQ